MYNEKAYSSANAGAGDTDKNIRYLRLGEGELTRHVAIQADAQPSTMVALTVTSPIRISRICFSSRVFALFDRRGTPESISGRAWRNFGGHTPELMAYWAKNTLGRNQ